MCAAAVITLPVLSAVDVPSLCRDSLVKALPSAMSRIRHPGGDASLAYYGPGEADHWSVQMSLQVATALAILADEPAEDLAAAGVDAGQLSDTALALFRYALRTHATGDMACTDGRRWGRSWISVLGLERSVAGVLLLEPRFTDDDRARLRRVMTDESLWRLRSYPVKAGIFADNVPESNLWNANMMLRTVAAYPDIPEAGAMREKATRLMLNGLSTPADAGEKWFAGANFSQDWALDHHGYMNVGYMNECLSNIAFAYFDCLERGRDVPPELLRNVAGLWRICKRMTFPDGRLCRVGGDTRSRYTYCQLFAMQGWLLAAHALGDADGIRFEREYMGKIVREQSGNPDGSYFGTRLRNIRDASFCYYSRLEADALLTMASSLHWHRRHKFPDAPGPVDSKGVETWRDEGEHAIFLRGPKSFRSAAFRAQAGFGQRGQMPNIVCAPADRSDLAEWSANLVGAIGLHQENDTYGGFPNSWPRNAVREFFYKDKGGDAFVQTFSTPVSEGAPGEGENGEGVAQRKMEIHAVGDGTTMAIRDRVVMSRVFQLEHGFEAGRLVVPHAFAPSGGRRYKGIGTRCATVDGALSLIAVNGGPVTLRRDAPVEFTLPDTRRLMRPLVSDRADILRVAACDEPLLAEPGQVLFDAIYLVVAGADAKAARKVADSATWDGRTLAFTGTDGIGRRLAMDFKPDEAMVTRDPREVSRRISEQFLSTSPVDYRPQGCTASHGAGGRGYGWGDCIFYATASLWANALDNARQFGDAALEKRLLDAFEPYLGQKSAFLRPRFHVDYNIVGAVPLAAARLGGDRRAAEVGLALAEFQWSEPTEQTDFVIAGHNTLDGARAYFADGYSGQTRLWIDDMYMIGLLQTEAYRLSGDRKFIDRAAREMSLYIKKLQLPDGLFHHSPDAPFVWGRGAGWMASAMALVLSCMEPGDQYRDEILAGYRRMAARLLKCQRDDGLWGQLVDDPQSWPETSCSAMFAYAIAEGVTHRWLEGPEWRDCVERAWDALCERMDPLGNISDVCVGTEWKNDRSHYLSRPRAVGDPHGQAPMLWLAGAIDRMRTRR